MSEPFDPYYVWLGIGPEEQPPNYYRLLGIRLLEGNADVISNAADRQMAHLRSFQGGKNGQLTQKLLNKLSTARVCLLNPEKKGAYDRQLQADQAQPASSLAFLDDSTASTGSNAATGNAAPRSVISAGRKTNRNNRLIWFSLAAAVVSAAIAISIAIKVGGEPEADPNSAPSSSPVKVTSLPVVAEHPVDQPAPKLPPSKQSPPLQPPLDQPAPTQPAPDHPAAGTALPIGDWVDVLRFVDPPRHALRGKWARRGQKIVLESSERYPRLALPIEVVGDYDFETEFTRNEGKDSLNIIFPVDSQQCSATLSGKEGAVSALESVQGRAGNNPANPTAIHPGTLANGRRYQVLIRVRLIPATRASVDFWLDGKPYLPHWEGERADLKLPGSLNLQGAHRIGFATWFSRVTLHSARLKMLSGQATLEPSAINPAAVAQ